MTREQRKDEHVRLAVQTASVTPVSHFDDIQFVHRSLPETSLADVNLTSEVLGLKLAVPIYINAMTGGSEKTKDINSSLASIAAMTGVAMAVGSQHAALRQESLTDTYRVVRRHNPHGIVFANIGADASLDFALRAVEMLEANALQIHVNVPQELVMPEGERDFTGWLQRIGQIVVRVPVPVIVKEVGFGMCSETFQQLSEVGVRCIDVSGRGGTNFIWIEDQRRIRSEYTFLTGWGQSTVISLLESLGFQDNITVFASGGIRNSLDMVKCFALGAKAVGLAGPILRLLQKCGEEETCSQITMWVEEMKTIFAMLGARTIPELLRCPIVVTGESREWCHLRGINLTNLARRSMSRE